MNKKGFTLVELLASLVILALLMGVAVPNVVGTIRKQRKNTYVEDAKRLVSRAKTMISANNLDKTNNTCYSMRYLDNGDFDEAPNGGKYLRYYSYVRVYNGNYYVTLVECTSCKDIGQEDTGDSNQSLSGFVLEGISNKTYNELITNNNPTSFVKSIGTGNVYNTFENKGTSSTCSNGVYYHPDKGKKV